MRKDIKKPSAYRLRGWENAIYWGGLVFSGLALVGLVAWLVS